MPAAHDVLWWLWNGISEVPLVWAIGGVLSIAGLIVGGYDWLSKERELRAGRRAALAYQGSLDDEPEPADDPPPPVAHGS